MNENKGADNILITITFAVPEPIRSEVVKLNKKLAEENKVRFVSEFTTFTPHITIYQAEFPKENKKKVLEVIKLLVESTTEIFFASSKPSTKGGYVAISFEKSEEIEDFHKYVVEKLNLLREGNIKNSYKESMQIFSEEEQENISAFGYPYVMNLYNPHMTVVSLESADKVQSVAKEIRFNKSFSVNTINVVISNSNKKEAGEKELHKFNLGKLNGTRSYLS